ncbi:Fe-S cluster assembly ATPase SufC [Candidatus Woesebacteria bacterium]|nr:Fe-S cluster assembly ATPase SufC [Candidatus Woesebacteria bacterium]
MAQLLSIKNLQVSIQDLPILKGVDLVVKPGELHVVMGPNGSGKSTLASTLAGHPAYSVTGGVVTLNGADILEKSPDERAQAGLFLAFQYPVEVPGVTVQNFLRQAHEARFADQPDKRFPKVLAFRQHLEKLADELHVKKSLLKRGLNEGFSGGEKKRLEILQMAVLEPKYAILDETDSGLDVDAIKHVAEGVNRVRELYNTGMIIITHYQRILQFLRPDVVHLMVAGKIVESGDNSLVEKIEHDGYAHWQSEKGGA